MTTLLEVAKAETCIFDKSLVYISIHKKLGELCLKDITDWSHVWIVFVVQGVARCLVGELVATKGRTLTIQISEPWLSESRIVDIKPYHYLENLS